MKEFLDIVDENGQPTGEIVDRETAHAKGILHRTSHVWLARRKNGKVQILLQKRAEHKSSFPGCYDISSAGHIPAGDNYEVSAMRELEEELGITFDDENFETLNGFMISKLEHIPEEDEFFEMDYGGYHFKALEIENKIFKTISVVRNETKTEENTDEETDTTIKSVEETDE